MTGPTSTHSDQNPVSGMAVTPSASGGRTGQSEPASYQRLLSLGNLILFNDELDSGTLPEPRCSRCGSGVPTCAEVGIPHADACRGFRGDMPLCWMCEREFLAEVRNDECDCDPASYHHWNCRATPIWAQTIRDLDTNPWTVVRA